MSNNFKSICCEQTQHFLSETHMLALNGVTLGIHWRVYTVVFQYLPSQVDSVSEDSEGLQLEEFWWLCRNSHAGAFTIEILPSPKASLLRFSDPFIHVFLLWWRLLLPTLTRRMSCAKALFPHHITHNFLHSCSGRWIIIHHLSFTVGSWYGGFLFEFDTMAFAQALQLNVSRNLIVWGQHEYTPMVSRLKSGPHPWWLAFLGLLCSEYQCSFQFKHQLSF